MPLRRLVAVVTVLAASLAGCSSGEAGSPAAAPSSASPYAADIRAAAKSAVNDFEKEVLADGQITRREYEESVNRLVRCAQDRGVAVTVSTVRGVNRYQLASSADADEVFTSCSRGTTQTIESLYSATITNPQKEDEDELFASCIRRSGLAPASFTGDAARRIAASRGSIPYPFSTDDPRFDACMTNPSAAVGTTAAK